LWGGLVISAGNRLWARGSPLAILSHSRVQDLEIPRFLSRFEDLQRFEKILRFLAAGDFTELGIINKVTNY